MDMYKDLIDSKQGGQVCLRADLCVLNDNLSMETVKTLRKKKAFDPKKTVILIDQVVPPNSPEQSAIQRQLMALSGEQKIPFYFGRTMTSQYLDRRVKAGDVVAACNETVITAGIRGALGLCLAEEELVRVFESGMVTEKVPGKVFLKPEGLKEGICPKDAVLALAKTADRNLLRDALVLMDSSVLEGENVEEWFGFFTLLGRLGAFSAVAYSDAGTENVSEQTICINASGYKDLAAAGSGFADIRPVEEMEPRQVNVVFIGGSTGGTEQAMETVACGVRGRTIACGVRLSVSPASAEIYARMADHGYIADILNAGGLVLNQCADPESQCRVGKHEVMVSNDWKNMPGYAGYDSSEVILTGTSAAVEAALTGTIGKKKAAGVLRRPGDEAVEEEAAGDKADVVLEGKCWKFADDIDTDIIIPTQWLCVPMEEMKRHAFEPLRPGLAGQIGDGDMIIAGNNFGCGSSREMAAEVLRENGVRCIIAKSFARIFFRNAINNGILLIECPELSDFAEEGDKIRVELNRRILCRGREFSIGKIQKNLYEIIADGGLVKNIEKKVRNGEL